MIMGFVWFCLFCAEIDVLFTFSLGGWVMIMGVCIR